MPLFGSSNVAKLKRKRDMNGLLDAINHSKEPSVRREASQALTEIVTLLDDADAARNGIIPVLYSEDRQVAANAARALQKLGDPGFQGLIEVLSNAPYATARDAAARALGRTGDQRAIEPLIACFVSDDPHSIAIHETAVEALRDLGLSESDVLRLGAQTVAEAYEAPPYTIALSRPRLLRQGGTARFELEVREGDRAVDDARIVAVLHMDQDESTLQLQSIGKGDGRYAVAVPLRIEGYWHMSFTISRAGIPESKFSSSFHTY